MDRTAVERLLAPVVAASGLEIDRIETAAAGRRTVLRVYLDGDGPTGSGPTMDEIADATRAISVALDDSSVVGNAPYVLEVSSRGVGRPLTEPKHFRRNTGRLLNVTLAEGEKVAGRVTEASDEAIVLDVEGAERVLAYPQIAKALVQVELNRTDTDGVDADDEGQ